MGNLATIDQVLRRVSDAGEIPGVVATVGTSRDVVYHAAFGKRDLSKDQPMTTDSVFWIGSMTKAITVAAAMQLVEQGKLSLNEPIGKLLPDLANPQVLTGFGADDAPTLRPAKAAITLRQLMTHTAGFCYDVWNERMATYLLKTGTPSVTTGRHAALRVPIVNDPGTRWEYGTNIDFVGKAVETASGQRLGAYLRDNMFAPLEMTDTAFKISDPMRTRLVGMHVRGVFGGRRGVHSSKEQGELSFCGSVRGSRPEGRPHVSDRMTCPASQLRLSCPAGFKRSGRHARSTA
jgi:methyl acetate hydrolase